MKKIMFNDRYGLTQAVLDGRKTMTRRLKKGKMDIARYRRGDMVAIAQPLRDMGYDANDRSNGHTFGLSKSVAWSNKMYVSARQCIHQIIITDVKVERLQNITDEDCLKEGIYVSRTLPRYGIPNGYSPHCKDDIHEPKLWYSTPREAFAALINKTCGKGTWESNPYVFVYTFTLIK